MRDLSPAVIIVPVLICLFGLAQVSRPWDSKSPLRKWKSCSRATQWKFSILVLYFTAFLITIIFLSRVWLENRSRSLLELSWLNGLIIEAVFLCRTYQAPYIFHVSPIFRIFAPISAAIAGLLQVVGFGVLSYNNNNTGRYLAFAGGCLFHLFSATSVNYLLTFKHIRHRNLVFFAVTFVSAALSSALLILINDRDTFFLANCILECCVNFILLVPLQDEDSLSTSSSLTSLGPITEAVNANDGGGSLQISLQINTFQTTERRHSLPPTPPPSPQEGVLYGSTTTNIINNLPITIPSLDAQSLLSGPLASHF